MDESEKFPGFPPEMRRNFWMFPRVMDAYMNFLSGSEAKVLVFVLRRTWGFQKTSDMMSVGQIANGGGKIGTGTGLSTRQVFTALHGLEQKGFITIRRRKGWTSEYSLVVQKVHGGNEEVNITPQHKMQAPHEETAGSIDSKDIERDTKKIHKIYSQYIRSGMRMTREAKTNIANRFAEYSPYELIVAIRNASENDYWKPIVETTTPAWFFASEERVAKFIALGPYKWPPVEKSDVSAS